LFARLGQRAVYTDASGIERPVRVISRQSDVVGSFGDTRLVTAAVRFDLRVAEVANPGDGDTLLVAGLAYRIQGAPLRDRDGLLWTVQAYSE
jgi:hypothetical protein